MISGRNPHRLQRVSVLDSEMAYVNIGRGAPLVFLHGNPTSSYLWRDVITHVEPVGHCLAPDLIGMGASGKNPKGVYRFVDHARYLDAWFEALALRDVTLVVHDWGSALGFWWAQRHPDRLRGLAYMEAIVRPVSWAEWPENARKIFQTMRSPAGEELVLQKNVFVERILPASVMRTLTDEEMDAYRRPWREPGESRRPVLQWPREIPIDGEPADVAAIVDGYARWLATSPVPKLFVNAEPGSILVGAQRDFCRRWPNQQEVTVRGLHFVQEDSPAEIGRAVADFVRSL
ncbi:MAG: haloalkane dehalogenase [Candidatus Rokuibacteriota bacterium]